jgi:hypothetical protein
MQPITQLDQRVKRWNQMIATSLPFQVDSIKIIESNVFAPQEVKLERALAFIGLHGTGKSLILRVLESAFGFATPIYSPPFLPARVSPNSFALPLEGVIEVSLNTPSGRVHHIIDLSWTEQRRADSWKQDIGDSFSAWYLDPVSSFANLQFLWDNYDFTSEPASYESEYYLRRADLDAMNNILGRRYDKVKIRSGKVDNTADDNMAVPFIRAQLGSRTFDNTVMSQGELWVHYTNWFMEHEATKGCLALLDEPETFLAAQGRRPFIDYVAQLALRNHHQLIIGTHSSEILSRFPITNTRICVPGDSGIHIIAPESLAQIYDSVGIDMPIRGLALVEDELAKTVLTSIFARYDTALTREIEIIPVEGASEVLKAKSILTKSNRLVSFAILDADQRSHLSDRISNDVTPPFYFLPGIKSPEDQLIMNAHDQVDWISDVLGISSDRIIIAVRSCQHLDHQ